MSPFLSVDGLQSITPYGWIGTVLQIIGGLLLVGVLVVPLAFLVRELWFSGRDRSSQLEDGSGPGNGTDALPRPDS